MEQNFNQPPRLPPAVINKVRVAGQGLEIPDPQWCRDLVAAMQRWSLQTHNSLQINQVWRGPDLVAAATITVSYPMHFVTGSTPISTINVLATFSGGVVYLVNKGTWKLVTGGNIASIYTPFANAIVGLVYDPISQLWYEEQGLSIGEAVINGVPNDVLYVDPNGDLGQDDLFVWDQGVECLGVGTASPGNRIQSEVGDEAIDAIFARLQNTTPGNWAYPLELSGIFNLNGAGDQSAASLYVTAQDASTTSSGAGLTGVQIHTQAQNTPHQTGTLWGLKIDNVSGATTNIALQTGTGQIRLGDKITTYDGVNTVANGVPSLLATVDLTAQSAAIAATTLYAVPASGAGMYRLSYAAKLTTPAGVSSVLGGANGFQVVYTDNDDSVVVTTVAGPTSNLNTTQAQVNGVVLVNAKASTNLQYSFGYTSVAGGGANMAYALHVRVEALG